MNPYVKDTRPSNVPVCQFQHTRIFGRSIIIAFAVPPVNNIFLKKRDFCKISLKVLPTSFDCTRFAAGKEDLRQVGNMRRKSPTSALWKRCSHPPKKKNQPSKRTGFSFGRGRRTRTLGTWFWRPLLYHLSYTPVYSAGNWWAIRDSNPGPTGYEPVALTN